MLAAAPQWTEVAKGAAAIAQVAALIVGGIWAYFKFIRGRTFSQRLELEVEASLLESGGIKMLRVKISMRNTGLSVLKLSDSVKAVYLYGTASSDWIPSSSIEWSDVLRLAPIFENHQWVEGGETVADEVLVPVPDTTDGSEWLAFRLDVKVGSKRRRLRRSLLWSATVIVPGVVRQMVIRGEILQEVEQ